MAFLPQHGENSMGQGPAQGAELAFLSRLSTPLRLESVQLLQGTLFIQGKIKIANMELSC